MVALLQVLVRSWPSTRSYKTKDRSLTVRPKREGDLCV